MKITAFLLEYPDAAQELQTPQNRTDFGKQSNEMFDYKKLFLENGYDLQKELPDFGGEFLSKISLMFAAPMFHLG